MDKIFEEGIKNADAMVIVLSKFSVQKPWVREELNAGMVKRISGTCKIIPVVIDECEVPQALQSTVWERIDDISKYEDQLDRIVSAIYGHSQKPPLGSPPSHTRLEVDSLPGINRTDTLVLKSICEVSQEIGSDWLGTDALKKRIAELGISEDELYESIDILAEHFFVKGTRTLGSRGLDFFQVTTHGFETYARAFLPNLNELVSQILVSVVNQSLETNQAISAKLNQPIVLIDYVLDILASRGFIRITKTLGGGVHIHEITTKGQRAARNLHDTSG